MAQQGKQMRVGACGGFPYHTFILVLLANGNRYEVDPNAFYFYMVKPSIHLKRLPCTNSVPFFL